MSKKILTVDDSKMVRMIVANAFKGYDVQILGAADGAEGVQVALAEKPDLVFMDITMPNMTGMEALAQIRQTPEIASIPVVMLSAESDAQRVAQADQLKVNGYISKAFKPEQLIELTKTIIDIQPAQPA